MRQVSRRKAGRDRGYSDARDAVFERAEGLCEAMAGSECSGRCEQIHHRAGRGGDDPHRLENLLGCCAWCHHEVIHRYPELARERGWSVSRHAVDSGSGGAAEGLGELDGAF